MNTNPTTPPSKVDWMELESNNTLLEPRQAFLAMLLVLSTAALLSPYVPTYLLVGWLVIILGQYYWLMSAIRSYNFAHLLENQPTAMTTRMKHLLKNYKTAWYLLCFLWGLSELLSQLWLPDIPRVLCIILLNGMMFLAISRSYMNLHLMHTGMAILIITPLISALIRWALGPQNQMANMQLGAFTAYLLFNWYLLVKVGHRFHKMYQERLGFEYSKIQLIDSLGKSQEKLHLEQQALIGANSVIQQFYSAAAHDLRQPVYAMQIYTEMLTDDPTRAAALLPKISQSCDAINSMFNTLFDFQRMHGEDMHLEKAKVNIAEALQNLSLHFEPIAAAKDLSLRFKPIDGFVTIEPLYLIRILSNLITNAIRYTSTGGVLIGIRKTQTHLCFEVLDTGIGIDAAVKDLIFTEFYKVNHSDIKNENLGLGLSIVKQLTARIDGASIVLKSTPGRGSAFRLLVPIAMYSSS